MVISCIAVYHTELQFDVWSNCLKEAITTLKNIKIYRFFHFVETSRGLHKSGSVCIEIVLPWKVLSGPMLGVFWKLSKQEKFEVSGQIVRAWSLYCPGAATRCYSVPQSNKVLQHINLLQI